MRSRRHGTRRGQKREAKPVPGEARSPCRNAPFNIGRIPVRQSGRPGLFDSPQRQILPRGQKKRSRSSSKICRPKTQAIEMYRYFLHPRLARSLLISYQGSPSEALRAKRHARSSDQHVFECSVQVCTASTRFIARRQRYLRWARQQQYRRRGQ